MTLVHYPAVFHEENHSYWVEFPDLEGCFSDGDTLEQAYENAKDALGLFLDRDGDVFAREIPCPSRLELILKSFPSDVVLFVEFDSLRYARKYHNKAVKKTLSIPEWLNELAIKENVNFSNLLQEALMEHLDLPAGLR